MNYLIKEMVDNSDSYHIELFIILGIILLLIIAIFILTIIKKLKD